MGYRFIEKFHVHTFNDEPLKGTTSVIKDVLPPFLAYYGADCAIEHLKANPNDWFGARNAHAVKRDKAADTGTKMHAELEEYVQYCIENNGGKPEIVEVGSESEWSDKVAAFSVWAKGTLEEFIFSEKYTYSKDLWVGGVVDCLARLHNGKLAVIDFKSSKEVYFNQVIQAAGYALQLEERGYGDADGSNWKELRESVGALIVVPFGAQETKAEKVENVEGFKQAFRQVVSLHELLQSYKNR